MSEPITDRRRFEVRRCLGAGGFGEVYLASMASAGGVRSEVALKVLHQGLDPRSQAVQRLKDEAKLLGLLNHPSILRIHDLVLLEERVTLVTEFVDGADLDQCVGGDDPIPLAAVLDVLGKVADALNTAYTALGPDGEPLNLLHRDIKPSNIRIGKHGEVKLLDFGIAKATGFDREAKTQTNAVIGSFPYMAPERFDDSGDTTASDVYSLGCVLFEALASQRLHEGLEVRQLFGLAMVQEKHDARIDERMVLVSDIHPSVIQMMREMLSFEPEDRPNLDSIGVRCEDIADEVGGKNLSRWSRRHVWPVFTAEEEGALAGRTITEASISKTTDLLTGSQDITNLPELPRPPAPPTSVLPPQEPAPPPVAPPAVQEPEVAEPPVMAPVPTRESTGVGGKILLLGAVAVLVFAVVLGVLVLGGGAVAALTMGGGDDMAVVAQPAPDDPPEAEPVADDDEEPGNTEPRPSTPGAEPVGDDDGVAEVHDVEDVEAAPSADCGDPLSLEPAAILGKLSEPERACLAAGVRDTTKSQTDRAKLGRVLLVDATSRCDNGGGCAAYESEQRYFFAEIDRSDADMLFKWALYLNSADAGDDKQREEVLAWVDRALERKQSWRGVDYVKRVDQLLEVGAKASYKRFQASGNSEKRRVAARNRAVDWLNNRVQLGKDNKEALQLCASAAGSEEECMKRMHDEKAQATVTFVSIPVGASITVDGKSNGDAPKVVVLDYGEHIVEMKSGEVSGTQAITVGSDGATRWTWRSKEDRWESAF